MIARVTLWRIVVAAALVLTAALVAGLPAAPVSAAGGQTVDTTIHIPANIITNLCNDDVVNLSGDLHIRETTTATKNGGFTVQSRSIFWGSGARLQPPPIAYTGSDAENSWAYYAPPPYPSIFSVLHWTALIPQGPAPSMYFVFLLKETVTADGTVTPVVDRMYLQCKEPCR